MNQEVLYDVWRGVHNRPGWLSKMGDVLGLSNEDEDYLTKLDEEWNKFVSIAKKSSRSWGMDKRPEVDGEWAKSRRLEYLETRARETGRGLITEKIAIGKAAMRGDAFSESMAGTKKATIEKTAHKIALEIARCAPGDQNERGITEAMIARAAAYPIADLIKTDKKKLSCPLHEDKKPSASIARGFFYCFSCHKSMNAIQWLMQVEKYSFPDAVRRLS